jgi:hypothetical protein
MGWTAAATDTPQWRYVDQEEREKERERKEERKNGRTEKVDVLKRQRAAEMDDGENDYRTV